MNILIVPMFALSRMAGPWSRAQRIATAFMKAGHDVTLGVAADGNCHNPVTPNTLELPAPSPLGLPMAIASKTFPIANRLGIAGRKPVHSFEEVLWLTGALAYRYEKNSIELLRNYIRSKRPDVVYSEFNLPAIIAAQAEGIPCVGTVSYPTQPSYACNPGKAKGIRRLLAELALPNVSSSLDLFSRMERRFVSSCKELEPLSGDNIVFCGFLGRETKPLKTQENARRDAVVIYLGTGSVPQATIRSVAASLAKSTGLDVYAAGIDSSPGDSGKLHTANFFDFSELLPRACAFINHGGQNSIMDALAFGAPQVIFPGKVFERRYNAQSIASARAGIMLGEFTEAAVLESIEKITQDDSTARRAEELRDTMRRLGGTTTIVTHVEQLLANHRGGIHADVELL